MTNEEKIKNLKKTVETLKFILDMDNNELAKEIIDLKAQIEKMKCCGNCKHCFSRNDEENVIACAYDDEFAYLSLRNCNKWEIIK